MRLASAARDRRACSSDRARSRNRPIASRRPPAPASASTPTTRWSPSDCPTVAPNWFSANDAQTGTCRPFILSDRRSGPVRATARLHFADSQAVIAQAQRRKRQREPRWSRRATPGPAAAASVGARFSAMSRDDAERRPGGQAGRIPPGRRRVVGDRDERAAHALRAGADGFIHLRGGRRRAATTTAAAEAANDGCMRRERTEESVPRDRRLWHRELT